VFWGPLLFGALSFAQTPAAAPTAAPKAITDARMSLVLRYKCGRQSKATRTARSPGQQATSL